MDIKHIYYYCESLVQYSFLKTILALIVGWFSYLIGWDWMALMAAGILYLIDFCLGVGIALKDHNFSIKRFKSWMTKLLFYFVFVIAANMFDVAAMNLINVEHSINFFHAKYRAIFYIAAHEFLSISVKLTKIGVPLPKKLIKRVKDAKKDIELED